ncbi:exopolygalacturonase-like [Malania oleifera]|uniref:exopolygalacturonase-like n=1 Tax=Malania oleifera TaxID=397392 RepID=UPI0025ADD8AD|nr:exopolygalacturonase-like [Malania oleifera]
MAAGKKIACSVVAAFLFCLALATGVAAHGRGNLGAPEIAGPGETIFNVLKYGAKPDGKKDSTEAFMDAWREACQFNGKARLVIPEGTFQLGQITFSGPCSGPSPMIVQVIGTLKAIPDVSEYPTPEWVTFISITGLRVIGRGTFDGQGSAAWQYNDCHHNADCQLPPTSIKFSKITDGLIRGISSINSMAFHMSIVNCHNFRVQRLRITAPKDSPNTDGIHVSDSSFVRIGQTTIATGDDCISIGKGATSISINKVVCGPGHGISVGSLGKYENEKDVRSIVVKNCTLTGTENGIRIKTWPGSPPSQAVGLFFQDIIMNDVKNPILIDQDYCPSSCKSKPSQVKISHVHYRNIRGTSTSPVAVQLKCSQLFPCQNVNFFNIDLKLSSKLPTTAVCLNAQTDFFGIQIPPRCP